MVSISCEQAAGELLRQCVDGEPWDRDLARTLAQTECADALFRILIEGLADRFEARLCEDYRAIFSLILQLAGRPTDAGAFACQFEPRRIAVLSRVTLGADIAITSVLVDAAHKRFPKAEIWFAGSAKSAELFAGFPWIRHLDVTYRRGAIPQRLEAWRHLSGQFHDEDWLVIDPDSRLTQLGLLPVVDDRRYLFFNSRSYGEDSDASLSTLAKLWAHETLGVEGARGLIAPPAITPPVHTPYAAVSLGTADNPSKQMPPAFEAGLIRELCAHFPNVIVDRGFGADESARVERAVAGTNATTWSGSFAGFASLIGAASCYVGYDSAGQHAAAAFGTPLVTLFKGYVNERMFARWQPAAPNPGRAVILREPNITIPAVKAALASFSRL